MDYYKRVIIVSIPYSSGQCFFYQKLPVKFLSCRLSFNPLFIRSVFLFQSLLDRTDKEVGMFQSLIHQVSVSFGEKFLEVCDNCRNVSIPYSSGQCFFYRIEDEMNQQIASSFNPLFIRSVFLFAHCQRPSLASSL